MQASSGCVRRVAADLCRSPTVMSMTTGSVSVRHVTDHYPSSTVGQFARHRHGERVSRQRGRHRASGPRTNRTPVTISRRREERAHRGCAVAPGQRDYPRVLSGDPAADFAGSLDRGFGCLRCSRRRVSARRGQRYLESVHDARIDVDGGFGAAVAADMAGRPRRARCVVTRCLSVALVCATSTSPGQRVVRRAHASASVGALDRLRRRSVKARRERCSLRDSNSGCDRRTKGYVPCVGAMSRTHSRWWSGSSLKPLQVSPVIAHSPVVDRARSTSRYARAVKAPEEGRDGRDTSVEIDGHAGCSFGACCLRPTRESTPAASMRAASCRSMARPRRRHGRHACDRLHAVQQPGDGGRSRRA